MTPAASVSSALPPPSQGNAAAADGRRTAWCLSAPRRDDLTRTGVARHLPLKGPTDNVPARVNAVAYFRIVHPKAAIVQIENFVVATSQIAQTTLRSVLGQHTLDELLSEREQINAILQGIIDEQTAPWGIKVSVVEVKDVEIPAEMQRAMARQAEAERERRAKIINAEGEYQASERLKDAALVIEEHPIALQLRYLQTLLEIGGSNSSTIIFPAPIDLIKPFLERTPAPRTITPSVEPEQRRAA